MQIDKFKLYERLTSYTFMTNVELNIICFSGLSAQPDISFERLREKTERAKLSNHKFFNNIFIL